MGITLIRENPQPGMMTGMYPAKGRQRNASLHSTNVASLTAQNNIRVNSNFQNNTIQKLSSGYRINSSADDAAGLAVANKYRGDQAELTQGILNAQNGISALQIVDGGLNNISNILDRLRTLATQSAPQPSPATVAP